MMKIKRTAADVAIGMIGGFVGTRVMAPVSMKLYELESEQAREQEDRVRPGLQDDGDARAAPER